MINIRVYQKKVNEVLALIRKGNELAGELEKEMARIDFGNPHKDDFELAKQIRIKRNELLDMRDDIRGRWEWLGYHAPSCKATDEYMYPVLLGKIMDASGSIVEYRLIDQNNYLYNGVLREPDGSLPVDYDAALTDMLGDLSVCIATYNGTWGYLDNRVKTILASWAGKMIEN